MILLGQTKVALKEDGFLAAFIDSSKAYDRVCREKLWALKGYGVKGRFYHASGFIPIENPMEMKWR